MADFNAQVKKGQVVAQLETDIYQSKVEQADANYKMSQAQSKEANATLLDKERATCGGLKNCGRTMCCQSGTWRLPKQSMIGQSLLWRRSCPGRAVQSAAEHGAAGPAAYHDLLAGGRHCNIAQLRCWPDRCRNISDPGSFFNSRGPNQDAR